MSFLKNMFGCCEQNKDLKAADICINNIKSESENNPPSMTTKDYSQIYHSMRNSSHLITQSFSSKKNFLDINHIKNNQSDKNSQSSKKSKSNNNSKNNGTFIQILKNTIKINENYPNLNRKNRISIRPTKTVGFKRDYDKNYIMSLSDISFISENNEKKENFSKLLLTGDLFFNKEIIINECGMVNSKRNKKDGYTVFGLKNSVDISGKLNNDFIINFKKDKDEVGNIETQTGKVFEIKFNKDKKEYTLYFINPFLYLYYKINNFVYFYPGREYFLFVGKIFLYIAIEKKGNEQIINIQVDNTCKDIKNPEEINKKYSFNEKKSTITIGRMNCDINICEKCISKSHGIIEFSKINHKFYYKNMSSTNGTTLLVKKGDFLKIKGEMNFKLEDVSFKIQEIP